MSFVSNIRGREILDSRGQPALEVELSLDDSITARSAVPSGASIGSHEALELRDGEEGRFFGKGLLKCLTHIEDISKEIKNYSIESQKSLDLFLIELDGTKNKSRLGANTILAISLAFAKAQAMKEGKELFQQMGGEEGGDYILPVPLINVLNGGVHADNGLSVQEFMIVPLGFESFRRAIQAASEIFHSLREQLKERGLATSVGYEGGFAPKLSTNEQAMDLLLKSIKEAGYSPGEEIVLALDVAASEFYDEEGQWYLWEKEKLRGEDLISIYTEWSARFPLISIEDGLFEDGWRDWISLTEKLGKKIQLVGDDLFVTRKDRLMEGVERKMANCLLAKMNQVGTLTETHEAIQLAHKEGYTCCVSHRSGETEDSSIADLSIAWSAEQIKTGSVCRGERVSKYNRFLRIEELLGKRALFAGKKAFPLL